MPASPRWGIPWSEPDDSPGGYADQHAIADAVEAALNTVTEASAASSGATPSSGYALAGENYLARSGMAMVKINIERTGGTVNNDSNNFNIADQTLCIIPEQWRPVFTSYGIARNGKAFGPVRFSSGGELILEGWTRDIGTGDTLQSYCFYLLP